MIFLQAFIVKKQTRIAVILGRSYRDDIQNSDHTQFMAENGYVDSVGDTSLALNRGEAARIIYNIMWAK